jgi:hypothetical protein
VFAGIAELARQCRFHDCAHAGEPGCAVSMALNTGELEPARWASYRKLLAEARYHERSVDQRVAAETKRKWKVIHKAMRHHPKNTVSQGQSHKNDRSSSRAKDLPMPLPGLNRPVRFPSSGRPLQSYNQNCAEYG